MLRANAGYVRFKVDGDPNTCVFQCGLSTPTMPPEPGAMNGHFTAFQVAEGVYDTQVYISNRSGLERLVNARVTNGETGEIVADTDIRIAPWRMRVLSLTSLVR